MPNDDAKNVKKTKPLLKRETPSTWRQKIPPYSNQNKPPVKRKQAGTLSSPNPKDYVTHLNIELCKIIKQTVLNRWRWLNSDLRAVAKLGDRSY